MTSTIYRVYIAAASTPDQIVRARLCIEQLHAAGIEVVSTWPNVVARVGAANPRDASIEDRRRWANQCLAEVDLADALWMLAPPAGAVTRGAWVELGTAWCWSIPIVSSGDTRQSIFGVLGLEVETDQHAVEELIRRARLRASL